MILKRWEKYGKVRGYLSQEALCQAIGMEVAYYKTGNVKHATIDGEKISNSECNRILSRYENAYYDFTSKKWSFDVSEELGKHIDKYFRSLGDI